MAARSIASLSLSFGLVSIPVKLYSSTETADDIKFNYMCEDGSRAKQQYVSEKTGKKVERADMKKGYEFDTDKFVIFTAEELKALEESPSHVVEILAFVPETSVDPLYFEKSYFVAPDKRGGKPYSLLQQALQKSGRCALAKWSSKGKTRIVQVRPTPDGLVFQQLFFAGEVRSLADWHIEKVPVSDAELQLALQIIEQGAQSTFDPNAYEDEEKKRRLAAIDQKIAGKQIVSPAPAATDSGGQVIDLMEALRASLTRVGGKAKAPTARTKASADVAQLATKPRRPVKKVERVEPAQEAPPAKVRARK